MAQAAYDLHLPDIVVGSSPGGAAALHNEVGHDHRLADESSLAVMLWSRNLLASGEHGT